MPTWSGFPSLVGRFHREFQKRNRVLYHITKVRNMDSVLAVGPSSKKQKNGELEMSMPDTEQAAEISIDGLHLYTVGLKV